MKCSEVIKRLEQSSPISFAESWDNVGLLAGRKEKEITSIMIALDATDEVIEAASQQGISMLITHHPLIFSAIKKVNTDDFIGRRLVRLLQEDICYYAMHTNFDSVGMADAAAEKLNLQNKQVLFITHQNEATQEGIGRIGQSPRPMTLRECAFFVKERFQLEQVKVFGDYKKKIVTMAVCPGSGKSVIERAIELHADVLITGDIDHHSGIDAVANKLCIIDAGHYGLEKIFIPYLREYIEKTIKDVDVCLSNETEPFYYV